MSAASQAEGQLVRAIAVEVAVQLRALLDSQRRLMDVDAAAAYMGMSPAAWRKKVGSGEVPYVKIDAKLRFDKRDLDRFIDRAPRAHGEGETE